MYHHQDAGHNDNIKVGNKLFKDVAKLKYLVMAVTGRSCTGKKILQVFEDTRLPVP
jgi:hypothetical protein